MDMPKKPLGLLQLYAREKAKELKKERALIRSQVERCEEKPDLKGADLRAEITNSWRLVRNH